MNRKSWKIFLPTLMLVFANSASAEQGTFHIEQAQQRYFDQWQSARTVALGSSAVVTSEDSSSVVGNPAGLGFMGLAEFSGSYDYNKTGDDSKDSEYQHIGLGLLAIPLSTKEDASPLWGTLGVGWTGLVGGPSDSIHTEHRVNTVHLAYSKALQEAASVGYSLSWFHNRMYSQLFDYTMENGFRHTVGLQSKAGSDWKFGVSAFIGHGDYDAKLHGLQSSDSNLHEHGFDIGLRYSSGRLSLFGAIDYANYETEGEIDSAPPEIVVGGDESGTAYTPKVGIEYMMSDSLYLRAGYRYIGRPSYFFARQELEPLRGSANYNAWSVGIGLILPANLDSVDKVRADFAYEYDDAGNLQVVSTLSVPFDTI